MNKVLFWDFDGTVTYSNRLWSTSLFRTLKRELPETAVTIEDIRLYTANCCTWDDADKSHSHLTGAAWWAYTETRFADIYRKVGCAEADVLRLVPLVREELTNVQNFELYADAKQVLEACRALGWRNILVSNNYPELAQIMRQLAVDGYFEELVVSAEIGLEKPGGEIYEYAKRLAGNPERCYMIGDNPVADVWGASQAGIPAILVHRKAPGCGALAQLDTLEELLALPEICG